MIDGNSFNTYISFRCSIFELNVSFECSVIFSRTLSVPLFILAKQLNYVRHCFLFHLLVSRDSIPLVDC